MKEAAYIQTRATCALIEAMAMLTENQQQAIYDESSTYSYYDFINLIDKYGISKEPVVRILMGLDKLGDK